MAHDDENGNGRGRRGDDVEITLWPPMIRGSARAVANVLQSVVVGVVLLAYLYVHEGNENQRWSAAMPIFHAIQEGIWTQAAIQIHPENARGDKVLDRLPTDAQRRIREKLN